MWIFGKNGHISLGQHPSNHDVLVIHAQIHGEMDSFVAVLDAISGQRHEVQETTRGGLRLCRLRAQGRSSPKRSPE